MSGNRPGGDGERSRRIYDAAVKVADRLGVSRRHVFAGAMASYAVRRQRLAEAARAVERPEDD